MALNVNGVLNHLALRKINLRCASLEAQLYPEHEETIRPPAQTLGMKTVTRKFSKNISDAKDKLQENYNLENLVENSSDDGSESMDISSCTESIFDFQGGDKLSEGCLSPLRVHATQELPLFTDQIDVGEFLCRKPISGQVD